MKLKWKLEEKPTGRYYSFIKRGWPYAKYVNGKYAAQIVCDDGYDIKKAKSGKHAELKIVIADHSAKLWKWKTLVRRASTLDEAKSIAEEVLKNNPHFMPEGIV